LNVNGSANQRRWISFGNLRVPLQRQFLNWSLRGKRLFHGRFRGERDKCLCHGLGGSPTTELLVVIDGRPEIMGL